MVLDDPNASASDVESLESLVKSLPAPRTAWVMVPAGPPTREVIWLLSRLLAPGDLVVDAGKSRFTGDRINAGILAKHGIRYVDCDVSGEVWGRKNGYACAHRPHAGRSCRHPRPRDGRGVRPVRASPTRVVVDAV
ncbi:NAD(P)-binding domain-containing protein [Rhodococcus opacus]|uniref:NAD(P)-binding domain-containing protein n=1 Tax=Rhodococcus opacus TaxID=37919 RepID=UPI002953B05E|nr:NAD(P)-binding domain-containing protein [Rhodococcus opacus]MDV7087660.1 NAD(P)-binding domain-containing protein [Rhodococcus opacus]